MFVPGSHAEEALTVRKVVNGHIVELSDGREVRLIGVECPELRDQSRSWDVALEHGIDVAHYGSFAGKSKDFLADLVRGRTVRTELDPVNELVQHHDPHMRFLAYLYVDDLLVNAAMIHQGYCFAYTEFDFRYKNDFLTYEKAAMEKGKGVWETKGVLP